MEAKRMNVFILIRGVFVEDRMRVGEDAVTLGHLLVLNPKVDSAI